jgi:AcrR family transcriptional regulator
MDETAAAKIDAFGSDIRRKPRRTQSERTALSDERMFKVARELLVERGTHNTTLKEIGKRAGYSRGLASNRFGSKEKLFSQMVRDFNRRWADELSSFVDDRKGLPAIMGAFAAVEHFLINHSDEMKSLYILWFESMTSYDEVRQMLAASHKAYRRDVERWVRQGIEDGTIRPSIDPASYAVEFAALIFGLIYQWLVNSSAISIHAVFQHYRRSTLETLAFRRA